MARVVNLLFCPRSLISYTTPIKSYMHIWDESITYVQFRFNILMKKGAPFRVKSYESIELVKQKKKLPTKPYCVLFNQIMK